MSSLALALLLASTKNFLSQGFLLNRNRPAQPHRPQRMATPFAVFPDDPGSWSPRKTELPEDAEKAAAAIEEIASKGGNCLFS